MCLLLGFLGMGAMTVLGFGASLLVPLAFLFQPGPPPGVAERVFLALIHDYVVYYGEGRVDELAQYDLAIIQPETLTAAELAALRDQGTLVVAYLSVGEVEPYRPWYTNGQVEADWILGENRDWGSYYVDARQPGWQALMIDVAGEYLDKGFDGIFLDTLDTADLYPETRQGMIDLVATLRATYPSALLVQNRGFRVLDETAPLIDAVMFEGLSTSYSFLTQTYGQARNTALARQLVQIRDEHDLVILALDYVEPGDTAGAQRAREIARSYGFIPAVAEISLQTIPDDGAE